MVVEPVDADIAFPYKHPFPVSAKIRTLLARLEQHLIPLEGLCYELPLCEWEALLKELNLMHVRLPPITKVNFAGLNVRRE